MPAPPRAREPLALIAAVAEDGAIGVAGGLPWRLSADLKRFKELTTGHPVIMGRRTYEEVGRPLAKRRNLVVSRTLDHVAPGFELVGSLEAALRLAREHDAEPFVIGGAQLYAEALPLATRFYLTEVRGRFPEADTFFPRWDRAEWREVAREELEGAVLLTLERR